jgi:hypothetical protein
MRTALMKHIFKNHLAYCTLGVETVPTRIFILADNTRQNTGHAYVQPVSNKMEKRVLSI